MKIGAKFSTVLLNRNQLTNVISNNSEKAELLSVIVLQLNLPNLQNLFTCQCLGKASTPRTILVGISTHLNTRHPMHPVTLSTACQLKTFQKGPA